MVLVECIIQSCDKRSKYAQHEWPTEMAARPLKGDSVESVNGDRTLQVVNVTHITRENSYTKYPALKVYLGL